MKKNQRNISEIKEFHIVVLVFSYAFSILLLICPYFLQNPYAIIDNGELLPDFLYKMFIFRGISFDNMYYVGDFTNSIIISLYKILLFYISFSTIFILIFKIKFFKYDNKLRRAIQYLFFSFLILVLSMINFYGGHLNHFTYVQTGNHREMIYVISHELIPVIIAILLMILDIPYLVLGIKEYKSRENRKENSLNLKDRCIIYFKDPQSLFMLISLVISIVLYVIVFVVNGGIEYPNPQQVLEYIENLIN